MNLHPSLPSVRSNLLGGCVLGLLFAFGSVSNIQADPASAQITDTVLPGGAGFDYTVTLDNTGSANIGTFWFTWVPGEDFMNVSPTNVSLPTGWTAIPPTHAGSSDGYAIQFVDAAGLSPGATASFSFDSTETPTQLAGDSPFFPSTPETTSVTYTGAPFSSAPNTFVAAVVTAPEPSDVSLLALGALGLALLAWRKRYVRAQVRA